jgi:hypothetical protein
MGNDDAKRVILARRARFLAAALAGTAAAVGAGAVSEACGGEATSTFDRDAQPGPCLSVGIDPDARPRDATDEDARPQVCLSPLPPDSSVDAPGDAPADGPSDGATGTG